MCLAHPFIALSLRHIVSCPATCIDLRDVSHGIDSDHWIVFGIFCCSALASRFSPIGHPQEGSAIASVFSRVRSLSPSHTQRERERLCALIPPLLRLLSSLFPILRSFLLFFAFFLSFSFYQITPVRVE